MDGFFFKIVLSVEYCVCANALRLGSIMVVLYNLYLYDLA